MAPVRHLRPVQYMRDRYLSFRVVATVDALQRLSENVPCEERKASSYAQTRWNSPKLRNKALSPPRIGGWRADRVKKKVLYHRLSPQLYQNTFTASHLLLWNLPASRGKRVHFSGMSPVQSEWAYARSQGLVRWSQCKKCGYSRIFPVLIGVDHTHTYILDTLAS